MIIDSEKTNISCADRSCMPLSYSNYNTCHISEASGMVRCFSPDSSRNNGTTHLKKENNMSFCLLLAWKNGLYLAADSQSSIPTYIREPDGNDEKLIQLKRFEPIALNYRKIFSINNTIWGFSSGDNNWNGMDVPSFIHSLSYPENPTIGQAAEIICNKMNTSFQKMNTVFFLCQYSEDKLLTKKISGSFQDKDENNIRFYCSDVIDNQIPDNKMMHYQLGTDWAVSMVKFFNFVNYTSASVKIEEFFNILFKISPYLDNTVGGTLHILRVTQDNTASWVKNGYDL